MDEYLLQLLNNTDLRMKTDVTDSRIENADSGNLQMDNNMKEENNKLIYAELTYKINGILYEAHNTIGRFGREKQYCDFIEKKFIEFKIPYKREFVLKSTGNRLDFIVDGKIILEIKTVSLLLKEEYFQIQRYLHASDLKLGILVNFRSDFLTPRRILRTETDIRKKI